MLRPRFYQAVVAVLLPGFADAALPWNSEIPSQVLKRADEISFDPLSLLAILWNPRASVSAARLFAQQDLPAFRWPHMLQIGAVVVPVAVLVNHLTVSYKSIHPAVEMYMGSLSSLPITKSNIGAVGAGGTSLFPELPVNPGDSIVMDALNFKPSQFAANDMMIVNVKNVYTSVAAVSGEARRISLSSSKERWMVAKLVLCTEILMGLIIVCGTVFSALLGDMWALALFGAYTLHFVASTVVSFRRTIIPDPRLKIQDDPKPVFAVFERPSGGAVIFKGQQSVMERWARTKYIFDASLANKFIYWVWILTGTAAALASVATMVNMSGYMQLGFLGILLYASAAELWLTVLVRRLQTHPAASHDMSRMVVGGNDKRYKSIIQATLAPSDEHRLDKLEWINLRLLPPMKVFKAMQLALDYLNNSVDPPDLRRDGAKNLFDAECRDLPQKDHETRDGIWREIEAVWTRRHSLGVKPGYAVV
jgi:hypothetical protein